MPSLRSSGSPPGPAPGSSWSAACALLDDRNASGEQPTSRLYTGFVREHRCADPSQLDPMWRQVDDDLRAGNFAVMLADYEWGAKLLHAGDEKLAADDAASLRVLMFGELACLSRQAADDWLAAQDGEEPSAAGVMNLQASVDKPAFTQA